MCFGYSIGPQMGSEGSEESQLSPSFDAGLLEYSIQLGWRDELRPWIYSSRHDVSPSPQRAAERRESRIRHPRATSWLRRGLRVVRCHRHCDPGADGSPRRTPGLPPRRTRRYWLPIRAERRCPHTSSTRLHVGRAHGGSPSVPLSSVGLSGATSSASCDEPLALRSWRPGRGSQREAP